MKNEKIDVAKYTESGFGDLYYGLISFIGRYAGQNFDLFEINQDGVSQYATAVVEMKRSLSTILDYLTRVDEVFLPSLNRNVKLNCLNIEEYTALEERCKEYILLELNCIINCNDKSLNNQDLGKSR